MTAPGSDIVERHPPSVGARTVRRLRFLRKLRGWEHLASLFAPEGRSGAFLVRNPGGYFAGDLGSFIERRLYLFGSYEEDHIRTFLRLIPPDRRGTILDVGANIGTHSIAFAKVFAHVHAFEPNPKLWPNLERNIRLNGVSNVTVHKVGLGDRDEAMPFFTIAGSNFGTGTLSGVEQYESPLQAAGQVDVVQAGRYVRAAGIDRVDAVKIDVQGFEPEVLRGLHDILQRDRPVVWFEVGGGTTAKVDTPGAMRALIPFACRLCRLNVEKRPFTRPVRLRAYEAAVLAEGDYIAIPAE